MYQIKVDTCTYDDGQVEYDRSYFAGDFLLGRILSFKYPDEPNETGFEVTVEDDRWYGMDDPKTLEEAESVLLDVWDQRIKTAKLVEAAIYAD